MADRSPDDLLGWIWNAAARNPTFPIVVDGARVWTWKDLLARANSYAKALGALGEATPIVPIFCGRNGDTVAAILGCLMSGRAFAPLSPDQPTERRGSCLNKLCATVFVSTLDDSFPVAISSAGLTQLKPDETTDSALPLLPSFSPKAVAYVLFTSGSTGAPKGVMVSYGNLANTIAWSADVLSWIPQDVIGLVVNFYFDISIFDLFTSLRFGVPLAIFSTSGSLIDTLKEIELFGVTSIFATPAFFSQFVRTQTLKSPALQSLRRIVSGGDFFPPAHVLAWLDGRPDVSIFNVWGPTETSIVNTMHLVTQHNRVELSQGRHAPVGRAHLRMPLVIVDEALRVVPPGTAGEICMLGACVTQGYLLEPDRTAAAYVEIEGHRAFRTQDLGALDDAGDLRILGRLGTMTKVNGHRVDLCEVEGVVTGRTGVHQAVAFLHEEESGIQELWMAIEPVDSAAPPDIFVIKKTLRGRIPQYMVPKRIVFVQSMPLTPNGKVDRQAVTARVGRA